jgi:histone H3/H4
MSKIINPDSFKQLIEDIIKKNGIENEMTTPEAIESLKNSTEKYMRDLFNYSNIIAGRANKSTVTKKELKLALKSNGKVNKR